MRQEKSLQRIHSQNKLVVGMDASFPPFENLTVEGHFEGFDVDLARGIAEHIGVPLELQNLGIDGLYDALLARRIDAAISALNVAPELTRDILFSEAYYNAGQWIVTREGNNSIRSASDLKGKLVGVELGAEGEVQARKFSGVSLRSYDTAQAALDDLAAGRLAAAVVDGVILDGYGRHKGGVKAVGQPLTVEPFAVAVRRSDGELLRAINEALAEMRRSGELDRLYRKWP